MKAQELRNSILQYAIQGKLVPQDPNEETINTTLEKIKNNKELLIKEKVIKREKSLPPISDEEIPFEIPKSWEWVRLNDVACYIQRGKSPKYSDKKEIPVISQKCIQWAGFSLEKARFIDPYTVDKYDSIRFLKENDLLWNSTGLGTLGRIGIYSKNGMYSKVVADSHVTVIRLFYTDILSKYIYYFISSFFVQNNIEEIASGSTKQKELNTSTIKNYIVPLPPLNEQQRIVEKIEELFEKVDQYDILEQKITSLNSNFPGSMEKSILQYAMQGKLVQQDPEEGSASTLLKQLSESKESLIQSKVIKREKDLPPISNDEKLFDIPETWTWIRLGDYFQVKGGKRIPSGYKVTSAITPYPYLRVADMKNGTINKNDLKYVQNEVYEKIKNYYINKEDIYLTIAGTIGVPGTIPNELDQALLTENAVKISNIQIEKIFLMYLLKSNIVQSQIHQMITRVAQPKLAIKNIKLLLLPLPPLNEQKRIVEKIEEMFNYTDNMKNIMESRK